MRFDDPQWCEAEYNPRLIVADAATYAPKWTAWAKEARARLAPLADRRYGDHVREIMDVFRAPDARGALVFIHGGYWRGFSKQEFSWVAETLVAQGITVAVLNYPLCPEVTVADIVSSCRHAVLSLLTTHLSAVEKDHLVVAGHSAGGYLTAAMTGTDWTSFGLAQSPFKGGVPISGVFDPTPLINTSINEQARFTKESAAALNLFTHPPRFAVPLLPVYGADESAEFHRQSQDIAKLWPAVEPAVGMTGRNHFSVVEDLREEQSLITKTILRFVTASR